MPVKLWDEAVVVDDMVSSGVHLTYPRSDHTLEVILTEGDGTFTAITVELQGSMDGRAVLDADASWFTLSSRIFSATELANLAAMIHVVQKPIKRIRAKLPIVTGVGTTDTVVCQYQEGSQ